MLARLLTRRVVMAVTAVGVAAMLILGDLWWNSEATAYSGIIYKPLQLRASLDPPMDNDVPIRRASRPGAGSPRSANSVEFQLDERWHFG